MSTTTTTHTPGPWTDATFSALGDRRIVAGDRRSVAVVFSGCDDASANARLITAAPDLLAALKDVLGRFENERDIQLGNGYPEDYESIDAAKAAIGKAEGREP